MKNVSVLFQKDSVNAIVGPSGAGKSTMANLISNLCENKTLIIIAHHLNTIQSADQILVLQDGAIVAQGKHSELLETSELYRAMADAERQAEHWNIKEAADLAYAR